MAFSLLLPGLARAVSIQFDLASLGGNEYRYEYTVVNDGSLGTGVAVELFDILFDPTLYAEASLTIVTPGSLASEWSEIVLTSAPGVPAAYDALALTGGISVGDTMSGFAVEFTWLGGPEGPGVQPFQIFDPVSFDLLEEGQTAQGPAPVPEPGTIVLVSTGLMGIVWRRSRIHIYTRSSRYDLHA